MTTTAVERPLMRVAAATIWGVAALESLLVAIAGAAVLPVIDDAQKWFFPLFAGVAASWGLVGALVASRRPRNAVGWVIWLVGSALAVSLTAQAYAVVSVSAHAGELPLTVAAGWLSWLLTPALTLGLLFLPLLFPTGRPPSRRWRPVVVLFGVATLCVALAGILRPGPLDEPFSYLQNPTAIRGMEALTDALRVVADNVVPLLLPTAVAAPILRYRRGGRVDRQQLKWFGSAAVLAATALVGAIVLPQPWGVASWIGSMVSLGLMPVAIAIAILRYRLYEIDRIISRTIGWVMVTAILATVFTVVIVGLQALLVPVTGNNTLAVAASTLVAAALFQPLRGRVQRAVDRRFNRSRVDADRAVTTFAAHVRNEVDLTTLRSTLVTTAGDAVHPVGAALWLRGGAESRG